MSDDTPERYAGAADAHLDLRHHLSYADYLGLDALLTAQQPKTLTLPKSEAK